MDEPLSALDANLVIRMQAVLTRLQKELGITFVYVTHSQSEAFAMADRVVIMSQGEIAQVGSPKDIYRAPANRFVAEFVGRNNILAGTVTSQGDETVSVSTPSGEFIAAAPRVQRAKGSALTFAVSADLVSVSAEKPDADNTVRCTLISEEFIGSVVTLFLESADGHEFKVQMQERDLIELDLSSGGQIWLSWLPENAHVLDGD